MSFGNTMGIRPLVIVTEIIAILTWCALQSPADWPQFRGPNSAGIGEDAPAPSEFGPGRNELWRIPLNSGHSSPCIVGDAIFLTAFDGDRGKLEVVCIGRNAGAIRWRRDVAAETIETGHPSFNPASSTPAADGERVVVYFGSCGLLCYDHEGNKLWEYRLPVSRSYAGNATSPIIAGDRVILYRGNYDEHYLLAVDKHSGKELWKTPLTEKFTAAMACTSCPIVAGEKLIVHAAQSIQAFEINSGKRTLARELLHDRDEHSGAFLRRSDRRHLESDWRTALSLRRFRRSRSWSKPTTRTSARRSAAKSFRS